MRLARALHCVCLSLIVYDRLACLRQTPLRLQKEKIYVSGESFCLNVLCVPRHKTKELFRLKEVALGPPHASYELVVLRLLYSSTHLLAVCDNIAVAYITFLILVSLELSSSRLYT